MDRREWMLPTRSLVLVLVFVIGLTGAGVADNYWFFTYPEPIHAYAQVKDPSTNEWIPTECNPQRPEPCLTVTKGVGVSFRAIDRLETSVIWGTPDCAEPDGLPWDKDTYDDPYFPDDIVTCDWDFDDGEGSVFTGDQVNTWYTPTYTFQNTGLHRVKMTARDYHYYFGAYRDDAEDELVVQWFTICVVDPPEFTVEDCSRYCATIEEVLGYDPGTMIYLENEDYYFLVATADKNDFTNDTLYVEQADRAYGIRVTYTGSENVSRGDSISVQGELKIGVNKEAYLDAGASGVTVNLHGRPVPTPVGTTNEELGGCDFQGKPGVNYPSCYGLYNKGLLAQCEGVVTGVYTADKCFYIDDSSYLDNGTGHGYGIRVS